MAKLIIDDVMGYLVNGQPLETGMIVRRYDEVAQEWFEGEVRQQSSWDFVHEQRMTAPAFVVPGYAPSPFREGDTVEIVSKAELYNREMDERNRIVAEKREKPYLPFYDGE